MTEEIINFLNPKKVAVVGVSRDKKKIGRIVFDHLIKEKREVYGINKEAAKIGATKLYPSVATLSKRPDLVVYAIPAEYICAEIEENAKLGIKYHLVISAGFGESGPKGIARQKKLEDLAVKYQIRIQGPNCLGNISTVFNFNASFGYFPKKGNIGLIMQSGAIGTSFLDWARDQNIGISHFISLGNKVDVSENDFLALLEKDSRTKVIGIYLESLNNPAEFLQLAKRISQKKPIVVLKAGRSKESQIAVSSHTGALAGSYAAEHAAFSQVGIIEAESLEEFYFLLEIISLNPKALFFEDILTITNAGGPGVLAADTFSNHGFNHFAPPAFLKKKLKAFLPPASSVHNPIDILGDADEERLKKTLETLKLKRPSTLIQIIITPQENTNVLAMAKILHLFKKKYQGLVLVNLLGGPKVKTGFDFLKRSRVTVFRFFDEEIGCLLKIKQYENYLREPDSLAIQKFSLTSPAVKKKIEQIISSGHNFLDERKVHFISRSYNFPIPHTFFIDNEEEAIEIAGKIGYPVVLKISDPKIIHRNKEGAVFLDIKSTRELVSSYKILSSFRSLIVMQKMIKGEAEIIVGAKKDKEFGHLLMFGSGGIHTEYLKDVNFGVISYFSYHTMLKLINSTKISHHIKKPKIFWPVFTSLVSLLNDFPQIDEVDLNPLVLEHDKLYAVDIKIKV